ncbi:MAG: hypothetical protein ACEPOW_12585 [Bacteroidales bacterium]
MNRVIRASILVIMMMGLISCKEKNSALKVDLSTVPEIPIQIHRYDKALFSLNKDSIKEGMEKLQNEYSVFLGKGSFDQSQVMQISNFVLDPRIEELYDSTMVHFPNLDFLNTELEQAYKYLRYYFPKERVPVFYTYISDVSYEQPIMVGDSAVVIGLDNFLGTNFPMYGPIGIPLYASQRMTPDYIVRDIMDFEVSGKYLEDDEVKVVLDEMIRQGKRLTFVQHMLPDLSDAVVFGTYPTKMKWLKDYEQEIWASFINNKLIYSHKSGDFRTFLSDGPYCKAFGQDSPANVGGFIGWQIVNSFMKNNPNVSLADLMNMNANQILKQSKYKP